MLVLRKILTRVCGPGFRNHTLGYGDRGPKSYPWLWKLGQNQTLHNRKCHQINHFWSNFAWNWSNLAQILSFASKQYVGIRSKWPKFAENIPLATEPQPKLDPWKLGSKRDPCGRHITSTINQTRQPIGAVKLQFVNQCIGPPLPWSLSNKR